MNPPNFFGKKSASCKKICNWPKSITYFRGSYGLHEIYGDNGTGKSSIVDAIEFVLQSRIEREQTIKNKKRPSAISKKYETPRDSKISIQFDNGEKFLF